MAVVFVRRDCTLLSAMRQNGVRSLVRQEVSVCTGGVGADWLARTQYSAILHTLTLVINAVNFFEGMFEVDGK